MTILAWKDAYRMGVDELDEQHRQLFLLGERLERAIADGSENETVAEALRQLVAYTQTHFREEETLMAQVGYRELEHHCQIHRQFVVYLTGFLKRLRAGKAVTATELVHFIQKWLVGHILGEDMKAAHAVKKLQEAEKIGG